MYDIITVGGGLGGATLAKAMAAQGARVLVLEREVHFKDRVRGEQIAARLDPSFCTMILLRFPNGELGKF